MACPQQAVEKRDLRRCVSSLVTAAYFYVRLTPRDLRALHLIVFHQPAATVLFNGLTSNPNSNSGSGFRFRPSRQFRGPVG